MVSPLGKIRHCGVVDDHDRRFDASPLPGIILGECGRAAFILRGVSMFMPGAAACVGQPVLKR
ncbi:MAG: hypothetical protein JSS58_05685 [Proteobacteria bacterium]|nr:hypothetical protein [Pseudomonadota bacterium]